MVVVYKLLEFKLVLATMWMKGVWKAIQEEMLNERSYQMMPYFDTRLSMATIKKQFIGKKMDKIKLQCLWKVEKMLVHKLFVLPECYSGAGLVLPVCVLAGSFLPEVREASKNFLPAALDSGGRPIIVSPA